MIHTTSLVAEAVLAALVALGWVYWIAAWCCVRRFARHRAQRRQIHEMDWPMVSILKPLKGRESRLYQNLASFCDQEYPEYELLFGVADGDDPAAAAVKRLQRNFPGRRIRLIVTPELGLNPKSAILHELTIAALGDVLVISDSDISVERDYLKRVVRGLADRKVGVVTCAYRGEGARSWLAQLSASHVNQEFFPSAMVASEIKGVHYSFGATMALRACDLARAGGFAAMADHLADDYELGRRITDLGLHVQLSDCIVNHIEGKCSIGRLWGREIRWARTIRAVAPWSYIGLVITYSIPLSILLMLVSGLAWWTIATAAATILMGYAISWHIGRQVELGTVAWLPVRQILSLAVWATGLFGSRVVWRGNSYRLLKDGQLAPLTPSRFGMRPLIAGLVYPIDAWLRRRQGIFEFSDDPECVLRINIRPASKPIDFQDGTSVKPGDSVAELHLWNEHIPKINGHGTDLAWAGLAHRRVVGSLQQLADYLEREDPEGSIRGARALASMVIRNPAQLQRMTRRYGFESHGRDRPRGIFQWLHRIGENMLIWGIVFAFNPGAMRTGKFLRGRNVVWISRDALMRQYGSALGPITPRRSKSNRPGRDYGERLAAVAARQKLVRQRGEEA
jgi:ceramide glucosyltransferase